MARLCVLKLLAGAGLGAERSWLRAFGQNPGLLAASTSSQEGTVLYSCHFPVMSPIRHR